MVSETVFENDRTAASVLQHAYIQFHLNYCASGFTMNQLFALYADEYRLSGTNNTLLTMAYTNSPDADNGTLGNLWSRGYSVIYHANVILEGLEKQGGAIEPALRSQMIGEAKFLRAFSYFYLVNLYGDVPLLLTSDYTRNRLEARTPAKQVYDQIVKDLLEAKGLMKSDHLDWANNNTTYRFRATRETATALLARVYLYEGKWKDAETQASEVLTLTNTYSLESNTGDVFNLNSKETLLGLDEALVFTRTTMAQIYVLTAVPAPSASNYFRFGVVSDTLLKSFEAGDLRRSTWVGAFTSGGNSYHYAHKYRNTTSLQQMTSAIRLAELYLIRAEARLEQDLLQLSIDDINVIRNRARATPTGNVPDPLPALPDDLTKEQVRTALEQERFIELFIEGHRWLDLKRWKGLNNVSVSRADEVMPAITAVKGSSWSPYLKLLPVPQTELDKNINLVQTPEY